MKSYKNITNLSLVLLVIFLTNACTKDFKALNTPPNLLSEELVTSEFLLSNVQVSAGGGLGANDISNYCGMVARGDNLPFDDFPDEGAWYTSYTSLSNNIAAIIRKTSDKPELVNKKAIARIMKVWIYSQTTDIYGDIPYFEANKAPTEAVASPKYDTQQSIYEDFFKELKEAAAELEARALGDGS